MLFFKKNLQAISVNEETIIEIIATKSNYYLYQMEQRYQKMHGKKIENDIGRFKVVFMMAIYNILCGKRSENINVDIKECTDKVKILYNAGEKKIGTDEKVFTEILVKSSFEEIKMINNIYIQKYNHDLVKAIEKEFSGKLRKLLKAIVRYSVDPAEYYARIVNHAVKGLGSNNSLLIRTLVTRHEIDMPQIREAYKRLFNKDMIKDIEDDTSGDYRKLLVKLASH